MNCERLDRLPQAAGHDLFRVRARRVRFFKIHVRATSSAQAVMKTWPKIPQDGSVHDRKMPVV